MVGGHYTYAEVPAFDWLRDTFDMERNNYDKVGHFAQGFIPALLAREILIRRDVVKSIAWMNVFIVSICLAFSALYELIEWWVAVAVSARWGGFWVCPALLRKSRHRVPVPGCWVREMTLLRQPVRSAVRVVA